MTIRKLFACAVLALMSLAASAIAQEVVSGKGPALKFDLGSGIFLNERSSLLQDWTVVNDPRLPVSIDTKSFKGLEPKYFSDYYMRGKVPLTVAERVVAVEINFVAIDVWNDVQRTLTMTEVQDLGVGGTTLDGQWRIYSENDMATLQRVVAFVRQVRLEDGSVIKADMSAVLDEIQKFNSSLTEKDIDPSESKPE